MSGTLCERTIESIGVWLAVLIYPILIIWEVKLVVISDDQIYTIDVCPVGTYTEKGTPKTVAFDCLGNGSIMFDQWWLSKNFKY